MKILENLMKIILENLGQFYKILKDFKKILQNLTKFNKI